MTVADTGGLESLLEYLKTNRGFDFTGYKRASLERRIAKRMEEVDVSGYADYIDHLEVHPEEFALLFNTILINVTGFFRDASAWDYLGSEIIPRIIAARAPDDPIRVWCAGCASGEETYTLAMVLAEALGEEEYCERVKIYATDVDDEALDHGARRHLPGQGARGGPAGAARALLRASRPALRLPQGPAPHGDLRPQRPRAGRADLAHRPARVPQHAHVLQRGDAGAHPAALPLRAEARRLPLPRQVGDAASRTADLFAPVDLKRRVFPKVGKPDAARAAACRPPARFGRAPPATTSLREQRVRRRAGRAGRGRPRRAR